MLRTFNIAAAALLTGMLLVFQYLPLDRIMSDLAGSRTGAHCVHCTGTYCTQPRCDCGHGHAGPAHRMDDEARSSGNTANTVHTSLMAHTTHTAHTQVARGGHVGEEAPGNDVRHVDAPDLPEPGADAPGADTPDVDAPRIQPCGSGPSGAIVMVLDKYVPVEHDIPSPSHRDVDVTSGVHLLQDRIARSDIFHPPAARIG